MGSQHLRLRERAATALERTRVGGLLRRVGVWQGLLILNYHQMANRVEDLIDPSLWSATQDQLDEHLRFLKQHFEVVGPEALEAGPSRAAQVMLTFDDGYRDNHDLALPVLQAHGVRAVFFITSGFIDQPRLPWWGELHSLLGATRRSSLELPRELDSGDGTPVRLDGSRAVLERLRSTYEAVPPGDKDRFLDRLALALDVPRPVVDGEAIWMSWDMVRALRDAGMTIGGHTVTHPRLSDLDATDQAREVRDGLARLHDELGEQATLFSYPYGGHDAFDARTVAVLREAGIRFAFSYYGGYNMIGSWDPYDLRRVSATAESTPERRRATVTVPRVFARW